MSTAGPVSRRQLLRWLGWFGAANIGLFMIVGLRYLWTYPFSDDVLGLSYIPLAYTGQMALLAMLPLALILMPLLLLWPRKRFAMSLGVLLASVSLCLLVLDTNVFTENRFHLSLLTASLFELPTWIFAGLLLLIFLVFQSMLAGLIWRAFALHEGSRGGVWLAGLFVLAWLGGTGLHIWGDAVGHTPVTQFTRYLPLYFPIHAKRDLARLGWVDPEAVQRRRQLSGGIQAGQGQLRYPIQPLQCAAPVDAPNVLIVLIDGLRPDAIDAHLTPNIAAFRRDSMDFRRHYSGGNSSRMGFFSFFYGLPSTYWQSFYDLQRPPVLMDALREAGYKFSLHSASGFSSPTLVDRTAFAGIPGLPAADSQLSAVAANQAATNSWLAWLDGADLEQKFFGFVYFDPPMAAMPKESGGTLPRDRRYLDNAEAQEAWNQYRGAMQVIDVEIGRLLAATREKGLFENTVIILTSDHGYEFDDHGRGYIGHASAFTPAQLQSALLVHWPGREPIAFEHRTGHQDLPVTLLQDVLACRNSPEDYALGKNLFNGESWPWMMAGSYTSHAIIQPNQVVVSYPGGYVEVLDDNYRALDRSHLEPAVVQEAMMAMRRFFR